MPSALFETLATVTSACLVLFIIGAVSVGSFVILGLARGWIVWGATHNETVERERFYRTKTFEFAALAEAGSGHD